MNISQNNPVGQAMRVYQQQSARSEYPDHNNVSGKIQKPDSVQISSQGQEIARTKKAIEQGPEIREDLVAELQAKIENGSYNVSGKDVAKAMIEESLLNSIL